MYSYKIFNSVNEECKNIWKKVETNSYSNFFQSFDFIQEIINKDKLNVKIVFIFDKNEIIAILPLEIKKYFIFNVLQWIGTNYADYCNPLLANNIEDLDKDTFLKTWKAILNDLGKIDLIFLNKQLTYIQDVENPFIKFFKTSLFSKIYLIELKNKFDDYKEEIKKKDKKHHYEVHRTLLKLEKLKNLYSYKFSVKNSFENNINFKEIIKTKIDTLNKKNKLNSFFIDVFENLITLNKIRFLSMEIKVNEQVMSKCFSFIYKNIFYYYIPTIYSKDFNNYKPGKVLIIEIIKWCILNNIKKFDFGLGEENYKKHFSNKVIYMHRYLKFITLKGIILYSIIKIVLSFKKL